MSNAYWVLTGPTAAGKTAALLQHASTRPMVAISADSRQVYRHMNIGTGTPTIEDTTLLSHKVIDVITPFCRFNAHEFLINAAQALKEARSNHQEPWVVGGTGLYIRALVENLELGGPRRPKLRVAIEGMLASKTSVGIAEHFGVTSSDNSNLVRVTRAVESACVDAKGTKSIYQLAGLREADFIADNLPIDTKESLGTMRELATWHCAGLVVIDPGKDELLRKIRRRVEGMFSDGLVKEVETLRELGFGEAKVVQQGIGYREAGELLDGQIQQDEAIESTVIRTRQYAKRQRTYFKNMGWKTIHPDGFDEWSHSRETGL